MDVILGKDRWGGIVRTEDSKTKKDRGIWRLKGGNGHGWPKNWQKADNRCFA